MHNFFNGDKQNSPLAGSCRFRILTGLSLIAVVRPRWRVLCGTTGGFSLPGKVVAREQRYTAGRQSLPKVDNANLYSAIFERCRIKI